MVIRLLDSTNPWLNSHELFSLLDLLFLEEENITLRLVVSCFELLDLSGGLVLTSSILIVSNVLIEFFVLLELLLDRVHR